MGRTARAALQYSKWLSKFICWVWAIYRFSVLITAALVPNAAEHIVTTVGTIDTIMIINEGTYLVNSLGEKYIFSDRFVLTAFNKGWFKSFFKGIKVVNDDDEAEEELVAEEEAVAAASEAAEELIEGGEEDGGYQNG